MAVPAWGTDLNDIDLDPSGTGSYAALGGGGAGLNAETDYYVQGDTAGTPSCASKDAFTNARKGLVNDTDGIPWSVPTDGCLLLWGYYSAPPALDIKANGGLTLVAGSDSSNYYEFYCGGSDTLIFETFVPYAVDPDTAAADATTGTPTGTWNSWGLIADLPTTAGPSKGAPIAIDALRYGRHTLEYTAGETADFNDFVKAEAHANGLIRRWGNIEFNKGAFYVQGFHSFGTSGTAVDFRDADRVLFIRDSANNNLTGDATTAGYTRFEVLNASTNVDWDNIIIQALGTGTRGVFVHTAGTFDAVNCQFIGMDTFTLIAASVCNDSVFRGCNAITAPGSDLIGTQVVEPTVAANTSAVVWDVATDPQTNTEGMVFTKHGTTAHHAIEFGTTSPLTMTLDGIIFNDFNAATNQNDSTVHVKRTSGAETVNITIINGGTAPSYRTDGAIVNIITGTVTVQVEVKDASDLAVIETARVLLLAGPTGDLPYQDTVTITRSGATASVSHTTHGLVNGDEISIEGANENEYNGIHAISNTAASSYDYTVTGTPDTPATGTILATAVILNGLTNPSGIVQDTSFSYTSDQDVEGRVRKGTSPQRYKTTPLSGQIVSTGFSATSFMVRDE